MFVVQLLSLLLAAATSSSVAFASGALPEATAFNGAVELSSVTLAPDEGHSTIAKATLPGYTIRHTVPEVRLQFTVADDHGRLLNSISSADLHVLDNRVAVPHIRDFTRMEDLPLQVALVVDVSDSVEKTALREQQATQFFVAHVVQPQTDRVALMTFSSDLRLWQRSTGDRDALNRALAHISQRGSTTNLYDSVFRACLDQFTPPEAGDPAQRILLLVSDGEDTGSLHTMADAISAAQRREIQIYALSVHKGRMFTPGDGVMKELADSTGGQLFVAAGEKDFPALFAAMEQQMRTQYAVSFQPAEQSPGFHTVQIEMAGGPKLRVHSRSGYFLDTQ
jgi:Ca-activated chloride channel family protein